MELGLWLSLAGICAVGAMSPGPSLAVVLSHSMAQGLKHGLVASVAHGIGVGIYAALAVVGLAGLIHQFPIAYKVLLFGGAIYLVYLAYNILKAGNSKFSFDKASSSSSLYAARDGFAIAFLNPKLAIFFLALFSQFIDPETITVYQGFIMCLTVFTIDTLWYCIVSVITSKANQKFDLTRYAHIINKLLAFAFLLLALRVVITNI
ncbi:LysE family translocator [Pseudoalteromonas sp. G4]|uniref:LysE family translocator n=1 Tax=Pseudoalteromonas sp. G4 TaxID=2992761 RepID=UPI00237E83A2|nr:LysE family translocator [Pseudoalteromonas sp. G4]MDE3272524.1 LysE family translocator [Pseudoalteromonas sp. G4]